MEIQHQQRGGGHTGCHAQHTAAQGDLQIADAPEELHHHVADVAPIGGEHRNERAQVEQHVEELRNAPRALHIQQIAGNGQMAGAGDGQEFRYALHQSQQDRFQIGHDTPHVIIHSRKTGILFQYRKSIPHGAKKCHHLFLTCLSSYCHPAQRMPVIFAILPVVVPRAFVV